MLDKFIGPGATTAEIGLQFALPVVAAVAAPAFAVGRGLDWSPLQLALASLLAFDFMGGVITNATSSAKRWYHRPGQTAWSHLGFVALHTVQVGLAAFAFVPAGALGWGAQILAFLLLSAGAIAFSPLYLRRPVAFGVFVAGLLLGEYLWASPVGLEWFLPVLFTKLLLSHVLPEAPFRPDAEDRRFSGARAR